MILTKSRHWLQDIKNRVFDSERAETIPKSIQKEGRSFSVYGNEEGDNIVLATSTMDTSFTAGGNGTEIILEDLERSATTDRSKKSRSSRRHYSPSSLPPDDERRYDEESAAQNESNNVSAWSYDEKNFSLSDIQILVDDASTDAGSMPFSKRTYYVNDTVQL